VLQRVTACCSVLQCVAVCCSVLQCVAVCCSVLQCVAVCCRHHAPVKEERKAGPKKKMPSESIMPHIKASARELLSTCVAACCSVLQCVAVCCSVLRCVAVCWRARALRRRSTPVLESC